MATNKSTIQVLERAVELIDELYAIKRDVLRYHIRAQKAQGGQFPNDRYYYDKGKNRYIRIRKKK